MRGTVARRIRKEVYGKDDSPRYREYTEGSKSQKSYFAPKLAYETHLGGKIGELVRKWFPVGGPIKANYQRRYYQQLKHEYYRT